MTSTRTLATDGGGTVKKILYLLLLASASFAAPTVATAEDQATASSSVASPHLDYDAIKARYAHARWSYPGSKQIADAYPPRAQDSHIQGAAQVACFIQPDGDLKRCVILSESPEHEGFGAATCDLFLKYSHVDPNTVDGGIQDGDFKVFILKWQIS